MDQQRDTKGKAKSSRRGSFDADSLPILFELPDRTPNRMKQSHQSARFAIHDAHSGPPAGHVDPPSGDHHHLKPHYPTSPTDPAATLPGQHADWTPDPTAPPSDQSRQDAGIDTQTKVAAHRDEDSMRWSDSRGSTWATRSAIGFLIFAMVTVAFLSGRGFRSGSATSEDNSIDDVIVISEDFEGRDDGLLDAADESSVASTSKAITPPGDQPLSRPGAANTPNDSAESVDTSLPIPEELLRQTTEPPSYVAEAVDPSGTSGPAMESASGALGRPSESMPETIEPLPVPTTGDPQDFDIAMTPPADGVGVVAYRSEASTPSRGDGAQPFVDGRPTDGLPAGMDDRLQLDDALRYTDTPYPIGNFLEILEAWEASEQQ